MRIVRTAALHVSVLFALAGAAGTEERPGDAPPGSAFAFGHDRRVRHEIPLDLVQKGIPRADPRDGIPAIREPRAVAPAQATHIADGDGVVGLVVGAEARAYPIRMLDRHEVVNDVLGGRPVAVTYCPLCDSAVAFRRDPDHDASRTDDPPLVFGVSGYLYESDVLLYDDRTETFWTQIGARGAVGPLTGMQLTVLPVVRTSWAAWRTAHPETTALSPETEHRWPREIYGVPLYGEYRASKQLMFPVRGLDTRLPKKTVVYGVALGDDAVALPAAAVKGSTSPVALELDGRAVRAVLDPATDSLRAEVRSTPPGPEERWVEVPVVRAYWFAWAVFHPKSAIWAPSASREKGTPETAAPGAAR